MDEALTKQLFATFKQEIEAQLTRITENLLALEKGGQTAKPVDTMIDEIALHGRNAKVSAHALGLMDVMKLAAEIESVYTAILKKKKQSRQRL